MACAQTGSLLDHFSALRDPRQGGKVLYLLPEILLPEILLLVLWATLAGANDFVAVRLWGEQALPFLRRLLPYEDGLPSHDTLTDVMNALDPELFRGVLPEHGGAADCPRPVAPASSGGQPWERRLGLDRLGGSTCPLESLHRDWSAEGRKDSDGPASWTAALVHRRLP